MKARKPSSAVKKRSTERPPSARRTPKGSKAAPKIPAILLEGDRPAPPPVSGPGEKYALGPTSPPQRFGTEDADLPEAYGTGRLFLTARDPHWLYANWDLAPEQQTRYNAKSEDGHLILRVFIGTPHVPAV